MTDLSLFDIEKGLHELLGAWQEAETPEALEAAEAAIKAYAEAEVRKVDGIRRYIRACEAQAEAAKEEASLQSRRAIAWEARAEHLKHFCFEAMQAFDFRKLEGRTGAMRIKGNGGKQAVTITNPDLVPDEFRDATITWSLPRWEAAGIVLHRSEGLLALARIRAELEAGRSVPGAELAPRGEHLEVV